MKVIVLSSGSRGNTTYIECNNTKILIDIGNTCKYVTDKLKGLNVKAEEVDAIFITHTHSDHIKGLEVFVKKYKTKVYITKDMLNDLDYLENYELIDLIRDTCRYQNIKCEDKLNQAMEIFEGESCE